jgi:ketosteroid isomerase-like protein
MSHPNEDLMRTGYAAFAAGDIPGVLAILDPDITWTASDHNALTGVSHGHDEVVAFFTKLIEVTGGSFTLDVQRILADDTGAVVVSKATATRDGVSHAWTITHVWDIAQGKATALTIFSDDGQAMDTVFA